MLTAYPWGIRIRVRKHLLNEVYLYILRKYVVCMYSLVSLPPSLPRQPKLRLLHRLPVLLMLRRLRLIAWLPLHFRLPLFRKLPSLPSQATLTSSVPSNIPPFFPQLRTVRESKERVKPEELGERGDLRKLGKPGNCNRTCGSFFV